MISSVAREATMRRWMAVGACALACVVMAGCEACKPAAAPCASVSPHETPPMAKASMTPSTPAPVSPVYVAPSPSPSVESAIADLAQKYPGLFTYDKDKNLFRFNANILFDSGSSVVKAEPRKALMELAGALNADSVKQRTLIIIGYTDTDRVVKPTTIANLKSLGKPATNKGLSEARAEAVAAVLKAGGIEASRMTTDGKGEANPVANNHTEQGKAQNRRVEIFVTPLSGSTAGKRS